jgi:hypothetical protein
MVTWRLLPPIGLHPLERVYVDILAMTKLEPKEISAGKIQLDFARYPMFLHSRPVRDIIKKEIQARVLLVCQEFVQKDPSKNNIIIHYTHDVVAFKDKHQLQLPAVFKPQLIESEKYLFELGHSLEKSQDICQGRSTNLNRNFSHFDLIVLEYG